MKMNKWRQKAIEKLIDEYFVKNTYYSDLAYVRAFNKKVEEWYCMTDEELITLILGDNNVQST